YALRMAEPLLLSRAIDRYIGSLEGAGYSHNTLRAYATRLNDFLRWRTEDIAATSAPDGHQPEALQDAETIQSYLASLRRRRIGRRIGVSDSTLAHAYATLCGFYRYLERTLRIEP